MSTCRLDLESSFHLFELEAKLNKIYCCLKISFRGMQFHVCHLHNEKHAFQTFKNTFYDSSYSTYVIRRFNILNSAIYVQNSLQQYITWTTVSKAHSECLLIIFFSNKDDCYSSLARNLYTRRPFITHATHCCIAQSIYHPPVYIWVCAFSLGMSIK